MTIINPTGVTVLDPTAEGRPAGRDLTARAESVAEPADQPALF